MPAVTGTVRLYAVIAEAAHGLDEESTQIFADRDSAVQYADTGNAEVAAAGIPLHYRVYVLHELDDDDMWDWGHRRANGQIVKYVHERAARSCACDGVTVVRRRAGTSEWQEADPRHPDTGTEKGGNTR